MGLDITAYEAIELAETITSAELDARNWDHPLYNDGEHFHVAVIDDEYRDRTPAPEGFYKTSGECITFRAGSYGGYNRWREHLAALVDTTPAAVWDGAPVIGFRELIHFSDCEGTIKTEVCAQLASDFAFWQAEAEKYAVRLGGEDGRWFIRLYDQWRKAFELASSGGAVDFR